MQSAEQPTATMREKVAGELKKIDYHNAEVVPAHEQIPQYEAETGEEALKFAGTAANELGEKITGKGIDTDTGYVPSVKMHEFVERFRRFKARFRRK